MAGEIAVAGNDNLIHDLIVAGDTSRLSASQKTEYFMRTCQTLGLNPVTQPFAFIKLNGKEVLYAKKDATEQLRKINGVSVETMEGKTVADVYIVTVKVKDKDGRTDIATGAVNIAGLKGDSLANATMKAETKAKRRATLSICGLGILDESELETIPAREKEPSDPVQPQKAQPEAQKPHGHLDRAIPAIRLAKTAADIASIKRKIALSAWTEEESLKLDDEIKNIEQAIKEGVSA